MNTKINISNRTWIIIAASIFALVVLIVIIRPDKKDGDLSLTSYDGTVTLTISDVSKGEADNKGNRHLARCKIDRRSSFFSRGVVNHDSFLGSIDEDGIFYDNSEKKETGMYLFLKDDRYFMATAENGYAMLIELTATVKDGADTYYLVFPCDFEFTLDEVLNMDYINMQTVTDYETLKEFYDRIDSEYYRVEDPYKNVYVKLIKDGELTVKEVCIHAAETGVEISAAENKR